MVGKSLYYQIMARIVVYSWADKLWQTSPPRKYIATRYQPYLKNNIE